MAQTTAPIHQLLIPKEGRKLAGVCMAWANFFHIDVTLVRIIWVLLLVPGGLPGIVPYVVCWILIPEEK